MVNQKKKAIIALKKARTSTDRVIKMIENNDYCVNIIQQNLAVVGLLKSAYQALLENHLKTCFSNAMQTKNEKLKKEMIDEMIKISKFSAKIT
jgi:CsoR family transcriptional regulator, copper-sensing transcriptional repressor